MKDSTKSKKTLAPASTEPTSSSSAKPRVAAPEKGKLVKKGHSKSVDPSASPKASRSNVLSAQAQGRNGAAYGIRVKFQATVAPEAGATQSNGRIIGPAMNRQRPSFQAGAVD
jgi:hypothetical protein